MTTPARRRQLIEDLAAFLRSSAGVLEMVAAGQWRSGGLEEQIASVRSEIDYVERQLKETKA